MIQSYAQAGEDIMLHSVFYNKLQYNTSGFFVDVGAYHPTEMSYTMLLYEKGWKGFNIDIRPGFEQDFEATRPGDTNLRYAIAQNRRKLRYHMFDANPSSNSLSEEFLTKEAKGWKADRTETVETITLAEVLQTNLPEKQCIDLLVIDVSGMDYEVLLSNDWKKFRPKVVMVRLYEEGLFSLQNNKSVQFLENNFYKAVSKTFATENEGSVMFLDQL